jgi:succinylarginine dihydrolase
MGELADKVPWFTPIVVKDAEVPVEVAVKTYLFNSQLVTLPNGTHALIAPMESRDEGRTRAVVDRIVADPGNPIGAVHYMDVRESMRNGGGPACLRLRVPLTESEIAAVAPGCIMNEARLTRLEEWVRKHYREELRPGDLGDPRLLEESRAALEELTGLLGIGSVFEFQR